MCLILNQIAKALGSMSNRLWSDAKVSDRGVNYVDPMVSTIWEFTDPWIHTHASVTPPPPPPPPHTHPPTHTHTHTHTRTHTHWKNGRQMIYLDAFPWMTHYLNQCWPDLLTHVCGTRGRWVNGDSGKGLSPDRLQAITWTNADVLSIGLLGKYFDEIENNQNNKPFLQEN